MIYTRNFEILDQLVEKYKLNPALSVKRNGRWENFSAVQYKEYADNFAMGLIALGFEKGDKILSMSNNRPEWNFIDMGMGQLGLVHVPIYPNMSDDDTEYVIRHSDARLVIVSSPAYYQKVSPLCNGIEAVENVYVFDEVAGAKNWMEIVELGRKNSDKLSAELQKRRDGVDKDDLLSIIYTSGTTGKPKGVMLSHNNFMHNVMDTIPIINLNYGDSYISFLPLCHVFERMVNYLVQSKGVMIYYAESIDKLADNLKEVHPNGFATVPRVLEKIYDKIITRGKDLKGFKRMLFAWAIGLGLRYELNRANGAWYEFQLKIANRLIFSKWREALGNEIKVIISGGAALQPRLMRIFNAAGIKTTQGYGLTETSPVISVNHPEYPLMKFGSSGPVLDSVVVKIADDGEILMKGPNLMKGYYKDPERTAQVIDEEGYFHTGDIGEMGEHRILTITDRKKEIFKLSTGKYVAPQIIENIFKESPLIDQLMVVGAGEKFAAAIISPNFEYLHGWCVKNRIHYHDNRDLIHDPRVIKRYQAEVDKINQKLGRHQQLKKFELTCRSWTPETGELSPTLKLKRNLLKELYKDKLDYLYGYTEDFGDLGIRIKTAQQQADKD